MAKKNPRPYLLLQLSMDYSVQRAALARAIVDAVKKWDPNADVETSDSSSYLIGVYMRHTGQSTSRAVATEATRLKAFIDGWLAGSGRSLTGD